MGLKSTSAIKDITALYSRRRFACTFFSLLITILAAPFFGEMGVSTRYMEVFVAINVLLAVFITLYRFKPSVAVGFLAVILASRIGYGLLGYEPLLTASQGISAVICLVSGGIMLRYTLSEGTVTADRIFAALNVYLLLGVTCGLLFCMFEEKWPGSFAFQGTPLTGSKRNLLAHMIYFSFVTLGTLGYGDVLPMGGAARALAITEAIVGQMYLVVVVARLVGLYKSRSERTSSDVTNAAVSNELNPPAKNVQG